MLHNHLRVFVLTTLLLCLLAACGGSSASPTFQKIGGELPADGSNMSAREPAAAPTAAPAAAATATPAPAATSVPAEAAAPPSTDAGVANPGVRVDQQQTGPLKAGEVDDNLDFEDYLNYLQNFQEGGVARIDVSERIIVTVVNESQQPVLDAHVRVLNGGQALFEAQTYAGGRTVLFPRTIQGMDNLQSFEILVEKGQASATAQVTRGQSQELTVVLSGAQPLPATPRLDVLFLLDATGSMGDEITSIQTTITDIASRIAQLEPRPELRFGLISYRDQGDAYVTQLDANFTGDVAAFREALLQVRADGGGDTPEDLNSALALAMQQMSWSEDAVRLVFLVADAPAHMDYGQEFTYATGAREAARKGVKIYPIAASNTDSVAEYQLRQLAQQTLASFIFLTYQEGQAAGAPGESTTMSVDPQQFTVDRLDDLVVLVIQRELRQAAGVS